MLLLLLLLPSMPLESWSQGLSVALSQAVGNVSREATKATIMLGKLLT